MAKQAISDAGATAQASVSITLDDVDVKLRQAMALVFNTFGGSGDGFREMSEEQQDIYQWAVHDKLIEVQGLLNRFAPRAAGEQP